MDRGFILPGRGGWVVIYFHGTGTFVCPIKYRSRNRHRNLWVGQCVSADDPRFGSDTWITFPCVINIQMHSNDCICSSQRIQINHTRYRHYIVWNFNCLHGVVSVTTSLIFLHLLDLAIFLSIFVMFDIRIAAHPHSMWDCFGGWALFGCWTPLFTNV